jgi:O-acetyl-ADP-ribose deacetylase (regulator of RNase III)
MTFQIIKGNLFDPNLNFTAIGQGVNCQGLMGAGIAVAFREAYADTDMYEKYQALCAKQPMLLPGSVQIHMVDASDSRPDVINLFTQYWTGGNAKQEYLEQALFAMDTQLDLINDIFRDFYTSTDAWEVGLPLIAGGIGGLQRHNIIHAMERILGPSGHNYTLVER